MRITNLTQPNPIQSTPLTIDVRQNEFDNLENGWAEIHGIWYGSYTIGRYSKVIVFKFQHSEIRTLRLLECVKWNAEDAIAHILCASLTKPSRT
jgi:hypothetical protein